MNTDDYDKFTKYIRSKYGPVVIMPNNGDFPKIPYDKVMYYIDNPSNLIKYIVVDDDYKIWKPEEKKET
jgi:hypothetical protein